MKTSISDNPTGKEPPVPASRNLAVLVAFALLLLVASIGSTMWPGRTEAARPDQGPSLSSPDSGGERVTAESKMAALAAIRLYQVLISTQDASRCNFEPSCSHFGQEAIAKYGFQGLLMTSDRLLRCNGMDLAHYDLDLTTGKRIDPVDENVLWLPGHTPKWGAAAHGEGPAVGRRPFAPRDLGLTTRMASTPNATDTGKQPADTARAANTLHSISRDQYPDGLQSADTVDYFSPGNIRRFADYLFAEGDYLRAAAEYKRLLFSSELQDAVSDTVKMRIGIALRRGRDSLAVGYLRGLALKSHEPGLGCTAIEQLAFYYWDRTSYGTAIDLIERYQALQVTDLGARNQADRCSLNPILGASHLLAGNWQAAYETLGPVTAEDSLRYGRRLKELCRLASEGRQIRGKSSVTAAILSAVVPGSGKVYAGKLYDGLFSFTTISFAAWQAIDGFDEDGSDSTKGWIYAAVSGGFYAGNIYGSALAAKQYNRTNRLRIAKRATGIAVEMSLLP